MVRESVYSDGIDMYTEREMKKKIIRSRMLCTLGDSIDIFVIHAPCKGYGDLEDLAHQDFEVFNDMLNLYEPKYMLHGHVHKEYGNFKRELEHPSGTKIINAYGHMFIEI